MLDKSKRHQSQDLLISSSSYLLLSVFVGNSAMVYKTVSCTQLYQNSKTKIYLLTILCLLIKELKNINLTWTRKLWKTSIYTVCGQERLKIFSGQISIMKIYQSFTVIDHFLTSFYLETNWKERHFNEDILNPFWIHFSLSFSAIILQKFRLFLIHHYLIAAYLLCI